MGIWWGDSSLETGTCDAHVVLFAEIVQYRCLDASTYCFTKNHRVRLRDKDRLWIKLRYTVRLWEISQTDSGIQSDSGR